MPVEQISPRSFFSFWGYSTPTAIAAMVFIIIEMQGGVVREKKANFEFFLNNVLGI